MLIQQNVPLSTLTTMRLGGPADFLLDVFSENDCAEAVDFAQEKSLPIYFLGSGANTIGRDSGFPGVILRNKIESIEIIEETKDALVLRVGGGLLWDVLVEQVCAQGYTGCEALSGIPSTVGAAPVQNIGAYGQELKDTLLSVEVYDTLLNEFAEIDAADCDFAYRHSIFNSGESAGRYFILFCKFRFERGEIKTPLYASLAEFLSAHQISDHSPKTIRAAVLKIRQSKLPDPKEIASSGSFFKNIYVNSKAEADRLEEMGVPLREIPGGYKVNVAWLLEHADLKGKTFHGFEILASAPLVLVNRSATKEADLERAKTEIKEIIKEKYNLTLEQEPVYIEEKGL